MMTTANGSFFFLTSFVFTILTWQNKVGNLMVTSLFYLHFPSFSFETSVLKKQSDNNVKLGDAKDGILR